MRAGGFQSLGWGQWGATVNGAELLGHWVLWDQTEEVAVWWGDM